ncbi:MAG: TraR/DksA C4-type zinc finger protein [Pseudomonadales bacterium]|jgi:DnaK suppressor protein|nr:TraR/DksA C4-type zinc finger protein [Pseudomonadales bacterium]MCH1599612.1 TraR/DksA C4-type zinc finger protein [Pseudomonadales bacterium]
MDELTEAQAQALHASLLALKEQLEQQLQQAESAAEPVQLDQTLLGRVSRMDAMQQQSVALSTRGHASTTLKRVIAALNAHVEGEYGFCRRCDEPIGFGRLQAQPESSLCLQCQSQIDGQ